MRRTGGAAYRADIDGLRAIAVLAVIGFHSFPGRFAGGFVGVDVFFVISGYLISGIVVSALEQGHFSFRDFYARRVRRIFPALIVVLVACVVVGWWTLLPDEYTRLGQHVAAGALFASNLLSWRQAGYFDPGADQKPLLHLWSLGVEEQFYIVWPLLLILMTRLYADRLVWIAAIGTVSFALNVWLVGINPDAAFYLPVTRVWELALGAGLAVAGRGNGPVEQAFGRLVDRTGEPLRAAIRESVATGGLAMIVVAVATLDKDSLFPGWLALLPAIGALAVIAAGPAAWINRRLLSSRVLVYVGLISYPLYLWHWPAASLLRIVEGVESDNTSQVRLMRLATVLFAFVAAAVTHRLIEQPVRRMPAGRSAKGLLYSMVGVVLASLVVVAAEGFAQARGPWGLTLQRAAASTQDQFSEACVRDHGQQYIPAFIPARDFCLTDTTSQVAPEVVVLGDSHAHALYLGLRGEVDSSAMFGRSTCLPILGYNGQWRNGRSFECALSQESLFRHVAAMAPRVVVLHGYFTNQFDSRMRNTSPGALESDARRTFEFFASRVSKVVVVLDVPQLPFSPSACVRRPVSDALSPCAFAQRIDDVQRQLYEPQLRQAAQGLPNVVVVNPADIMCHGGQCYGAMDGKLLYSDEHHLSLAGAQRVARQVLRLF